METNHFYNQTRDAAMFFIDKKGVSVSLLKKNLKLDIYRLSRIVFLLQNIGIISRQEGKNKRTLLVNDVPTAMQKIDEYIANSNKKE